jgi:hypothetical protein
VERAMGFGKSSNKTAVQQTLYQQQLTDQKEAEHKAAIEAGKQSIDGAFKQYDDPYYSGLYDAYMNYYTPQVDTQYQDARKKLTYQFADSGNLDSTSYGDTLGKLTEELNRARTGIANEAQNSVDQRKQQVSNTMSGLYSQNSAAADPSSAAAQAGSAAGSLNTPLNTSPLGDIFASFLSNYGAFTAGKSKTAPSLTGGSGGPGATASIGGPSRVVN